MNQAMKWLLAFLVLVVALLHQDFWLWRNKSLVFGFLPSGLAYHLGYSILAALTMWALVRFAWPAHLEHFETFETFETPEEFPASNEAHS